MHDESYAFFKTILETPSPSGYEHPVQSLVREWAGRFADEVTTDRHGSVHATINPGGSPRIMLAGHCDQIALMVQHIDDQGYLHVQPIGGWDMQILLGQALTVWTETGGIPGVISRRAIHLMTEKERANVPQWTEVWVDIGAKDGDEAKDLVTPGDSITLRLGVTEMRHGLICSPGVDDKSGLWVVMEALRLLKNRPLQAAVFCVSTVQEEIGLRGATTSAHAIDPHVGIAVDVCHATDTPGTDKKTQGEIKLGQGPAIFRGPNINPRVYERLRKTSLDMDIPVQLCGAPRATGTDANAMQLARSGVATGLIGLPNRYMHSPVEIVSLEDLDNAAQLLAELCVHASPDMDWTP